MAKHKVRGFLSPYKTYVFRDRDPVLEAFVALRRNRNMSFRLLHAAGGPTVTTLANWENGKVISPRHMTIAAAASALGATGIVFNGGNPYFITSVVKKPSLKLVSGGRK